MSLSVTRLISVLAEAKREHGVVEPDLPAHDWEEWYAAYIWSRLSGHANGLHSIGFANDFVYERAGTPKSARCLPGRESCARGGKTSRSSGSNVKTGDSYESSSPGKHQGVAE